MSDLEKTNTGQTNYQVFVDKKRRKIVKSDFRKLVDFQQPLWIDVFTIIFGYLPDKSLVHFLSASKTVYDLVKERGVFHNDQEQLVFSHEESSLNLHSKFYFSQIVMRGDVIFNEPTKGIINRQRYLRKLAVYHGVVDVRIFTGRSTQGNLLFPNLKKIDFWSCSLEQCHFWEFIRTYPKSDQITLFHESNEHPWSKETLQKFVRTGKTLGGIIISPTNLTELSAEDCIAFKDVNVKKITAYEALDFDYYVKVLHCEQYNEYVKEIEFIFSEDGTSFGYEEHAEERDRLMKDAFNGGFKNVECIILANFNEEKLRDSRNHTIAERIVQLSNLKYLKKIVLDSYQGKFTKIQLEYIKKNSLRFGWSVEIKTKYEEDGPRDTLIMTRECPSK